VTSCPGAEEEIVDRVPLYWPDADRTSLVSPKVWIGSGRSKSPVVRVGRG